MSRTFCCSHKFSHINPGVALSSKIKTKLSTNFFDDVARVYLVPPPTVFVYILEQRERLKNKAKAEMVPALVSALCVDCESLMENVD